MINPLLKQLNNDITIYLAISRERLLLQTAVIEKRFADAEMSMKNLEELLKKEGSVC